MNHSEATNQQTLGGNLLKKIGLTGSGRQLFADGEYRYYLHRLPAGESLKVDDLASCTVYVSALASGATLTLDGDRKLHAGDAVQSEKQKVTFCAQGGEATLLVAGITQAIPQLASKSGITVTSDSGIKKVIKPWGHELWINGEHAGYAFKQIFIKTGTKTSLQYHRLKRETNVLFEGQAALHYKSNESVANDDVKSVDLSQNVLDPITSVDVWPNTLHRLEAVTDVLLYEVSTPHLDDVIRISDDSGRAHGRIDSEHKK